MKISLDGKVAVVTGATGGIGRQTALTLAKNGAYVFLMGRNDDIGEEIVSLIQKDGLQAEYMHVDVRSEFEVNNAVECIIREKTKIDILIHSAGYGKKTCFTDLSFEEWKENIDINLNGSFLIARAVAKQMVSKRYGKIVFISSGSILTGSGGGAPYVAAKSGQVGLAKAMARELASSNINVNVIGPRNIVTPMLSNVYTDDGKQELKKKIPLGRLGTVSDVADIALFLSSDVSGYITGQFILVDGGRTFYS